MSRFIDADALIEAHYDYCTTHHGEADCFYTWSLMLMKNAPTIEPKRGEWVKRKSEESWATVDFAYCSECKQPIIHKHLSPLWNFCPNCGADMRKESE